MSKIKLKSLIKEQSEKNTEIFLPDTTMTYTQLKKYLKRVYGINVSK